MEQLNDGAVAAEERKPVLVYVDEMPDERDNFVNDAIDTGLFQNIYSLVPKQNLNEMLEEIASLKVDALVSDFNLSEGGPVDYSGEDLVSAFLEMRNDFPCFIRTSFEEHALNTSADVNRVYSKGADADIHSATPLFQRIVLQVKRHQAQLVGWKVELDGLLKLIEAKTANAKDVERIIELDGFIEAYFGANSAVPSNIKGRVLQKQNDLLDMTERLINDIEQRLAARS